MDNKTIHLCKQLYYKYTICNIKEFGGNEMLLKNKYFRLFIFSFIAIIAIAIYNISFLNRVLEIIFAAFLITIISDLAFQNKKIRDFSLLQKISLVVMAVGIFISVFIFTSVT